MTSASPIAVIGMGCRFPGAASPAELWLNVTNDRCSITPLPESRFNARRYYDPELGAYAKSYSAIGGIIEDHRFTAQAHLTPRALESTDVAHLWALEVAEQTFEDAGLDPGALAHSNTAVIVGHARGSMLSANMAFATAAEGLILPLSRLPLEVRRRTVDAIHERYP